MLFFDDKLLLKYSGVTGSLLAIDRAEIARDAARVARDAAYAAAYDASLCATDNTARVARDAACAAYAAAYADVYAAYKAACAADNTARVARDAAARVTHDATDNAAYKAACAADIVASHDVYAACEHAKPYKPFKSLSETALSALSIVSAPLLLTLLALDEMLSFIVSSLKSIYNFATSKPGEAKELGEEAAGHLLNAFKSLLAAAVSPVENPGDFAGSCVTTLTTGTDENPDIFSAMNP